MSSQIAQLLLDKAEEIRLSSPTEVAVGLMKEAGVKEEDARLQIAQHEFEKEACNQLVMSGIDIDTAVSMVKAAGQAGLNLKEMTSYTPEIEVDPTVELLQKVASYVEALESELDTLKQDFEQKAEYDNAFSEVVLPDSIIKAASTGAFTNEDLAALQKMDQEVITKVASVMEQPWEMGRATGMSRPQTDPFLEFLAT
jgi:hypothetical protein